MAIKMQVNHFNPDLKPEKLEQTILFFLGQINNRHLGREKLMKLLYYADFDHYERYEQSITGARYRKLDHGPVPDDAEAVINRLIQRGQIAQQQVHGEGYRQFRYEPKVSYDPNVFSPEELDTLYQVAQRWAMHSAQQIEMASHGEAPWIAVRHNDVIPYYLAHYRNNYGAMDLDENECKVTV